MSVFEDAKPYTDVLHREIEQLRKTISNYKDEFAEFRTRYDAMQRLVDKATVFVIGTDEHGYQITVEKRADDRWAVVLLGSVLNTDNQWEYERLPSNRDIDFKDRTRYTFDVAMTKAAAMTVPPKPKAKLVDEVIINV